MRRVRGGGSGGMRIGENSGCIGVAGGGVERKVER